MKLSLDQLPNYITIADARSSWYTEPTNTFDFVDRNSTTLVVTIGDSWTWGTDLDPNAWQVQGSAYAVTEQQQRINQTRIDHCYGNLIADQLSADWLNLSLSAVGNFWIATRAEELARIIPKLDYKKIIVICAFSPAGRWFNTQYDRHIDYVEWFKHNSDYDQLLARLNSECVARIQQALDLDHVQLLFGTTWADACGLDQVPEKQLLARPWYTLLDCGTSPTTYFCHYHERLSSATEFMPPDQHKQFKQWFLHTVDATTQRLELLKDPEKFNNSHPTAAGHRLWADYILKHLCDYT